MKNMKKWYKSKSIWSALLKTIAGLAGSIALILNGDLALTDFLPGAIIGVWTMVDVIIRFNTSEKLK